MPILRRLLLGTPLEHVARRIYRLVRGRPAADIRHERDTALALARMRSALAPDAVCVDIGSHRGEWLEYFADICPAGQKIAIEPLPSLASRLRSRFPAVELHQCALSDHEGSAEFVHAVDIEGWSGLREQDYPARTRTDRITVELRTLDKIVGDRHVDFVKIDVEGAELLALAGGVNMLRRCKPLVHFEFAKVHAVPYGIGPKEVVDFFASCQMKVTKLDGTPLNTEDLQALFDQADVLQYGPSAETNFLAEPAAT